MQPAWPRQKMEGVSGSLADLADSFAVSKQGASSRLLLFRSIEHQSGTAGKTLCGFVAATPLPG